MPVLLPEARGAIGKWSAIVALAIPIGPLIGGLAVDFLSWHFVFLLNLPIAGLILVLLASLPRPLMSLQHPPLDIYGSVLITLSLGLYHLWLAGSRQRGIFSPP